jgi:hypothetical protein
MARRIVPGLSCLLAGALVLCAGPASAQQAAQDAAALNPAEASCVAQSLGSACDSSNAQGAGGTCQAGCCCHYLTDPEGATVCAPCLACSDTAYLDPAYTAGACSDGGTLVPDAGSVIPVVDSGAVAPTGGPPPSSNTSSGCASAPRATGAAPSAAFLLFTAAAVGSIAMRARRRGRG